MDGMATTKSPHILYHKQQRGVGVSVGQRNVHEIHAGRGRGGCEMLSGACHTSEGRLGNRGEVRRVVLMGCTIGVFDMNSGRLDAEARERRLDRARLEEA